MEIAVITMEHLVQIIFKLVMVLLQVKVEFGLMVMIMLFMMDKDL